MNAQQCLKGFARPGLLLGFETTGRQICQEVFQIISNTMLDLGTSQDDKVTCCKDATETWHG
jgi:hypothetical protein